MKKKPARKILTVVRPDVDASCLVVDSPHSGRDYPADFKFSAPLHELRKAEDTRMDDILSFMPEIGVTLLHAHFPRSYVDTNRPDDITAHKSKLTGVYVPEEKGIVRARCTPRSGVNVYDRRLPLREVFNRVVRYYKPYHKTLENLLAEKKKNHGHAVHVNCHSMPSTTKRGTETNPFDIIIGTLDGQTADAALVARLKELCEARGYSVGLEIPGYKGREIVGRHGNPANGIHSIQFEINRKLYMDEETLELTKNTQKLSQDMRHIFSDFRDFCTSWTPAVQPLPATPKI